MQESEFFIGDIVVYEDSLHEAVNVYSTGELFIRSIDTGEGFDVPPYMVDLDD